MQPLHDGLEYKSFTYPYIGENTGIFGVQDYTDNTGWNNDTDTGTGWSYNTDTNTGWGDSWSTDGQTDSGWSNDWSTSSDGGLFLG